jgi:membrane protein
MIHLLRLTVRRAREERLPQVAGSLTFTTVLSLVPLLAVSFALFAHVRVFRRVGASIQHQLLSGLFPADIASSVPRHLARFAANASALSWIGMSFALFSAIAMLLTVENVFNRIWQVKKDRPLLRRVLVYVLVLALGPPLLGASLWGMSSLLGASRGWAHSVPRWVLGALDLAPALLAVIGSACLFYWVPNAPVRRTHALFGGLLAGIGFELGKRGFAAYLLKMPTYKAVYGAFAVLPVFLLWVYVSWLVMLAAALVTANLARGGSAGSARRPARAR